MILSQNKDGNISLTSDGHSLISFKVLNKRKDRDDIYKYIYYMYDPESKFSSMLPTSRRDLIERDVIGKKIKITKDIDEAIKSYKDITIDPKFALLEGVKKKIEEFIAFYSDTAIDIDNYDKLTKALVNAEKLLAVKKKLEDEVMDSKNSKLFGGGEASLFEDND